MLKHFGKYDYLPSSSSTKGLIPLDKAVSSHYAKLS